MKRRFNSALISTIASYGLLTCTATAHVGGEYDSMQGTATQTKNNQASASANTSQKKKQLPQHSYSARYYIYQDDDKVGHAIRRLTIESESEQQTPTCKLYTDTQVSKYFISYQLTQSSRFLCPAHGISMPLEFNSEVDSTFKDEFIHQDFNWEAMTETGKNDEGQWQHSITANTQDRISLHWQLSRDIAAGETDVQYPVSYDGQQKDYRYQVQNKETITLPYGEIETIKIKRIRDNKRRETFLWLAPSLQYIPVRIRQFKEGDEQADMQLKSVEWPIK